MFLRARGCRGVELHRTVERPSEFTLHVYWETLEDHMVHFRESADFKIWRDLVGPFFAAPPVVTHSEVVVGPALAQ